MSMVRSNESRVTNAESLQETLEKRDLKGGEGRQHGR